MKGAKGAKGAGFADADRVRALLDRVTHLRGRVEARDAKSLAVLALGSGGVLRLETTAKVVRVLRIGVATGGRLPVRRDDELAVLWVGATLAGELRLAARDWRERVVLRVPRYEIERIELSRGTKAAERLERGASGWRATAPANAGVDGAAVRRLLDRLATLRVERFVDGAVEAGATSWRIGLRLRRRGLGTADETRRVVLLLAPLDAGRCRGSISDSGSTKDRDRGEVLAFDLAKASCEPLRARLTFARRR